MKTALSARVLWLFVSLCVAGTPVLAEKAPVPAPSDAEVNARVDGLLTQMTLKEKLAQMTQVGGEAPPENVTFPGMERLLRPDKAALEGVGSVLWLNKPAEINRLQRIAVEQSRLHIPILFGLDVVQGYHTIFPAPLAMASSWDPEMAEKSQTVAAREARAGGIAWTFAPMVDIARDPRWGRIVEGAGEDPFLGAAMARAQVRGFQGPNVAAPDRVLACVKHFAGYGAAMGGRDYDSSYISEDQLWNVYFPPFKAAVDAGVATLMSAYMDLNDVPATGNRFLLQEVLRDTWGFKGFVVSDANAVSSLTVHGFARDRADAAYRGMDAGVNMDMVGMIYHDDLEGLVRSGRVAEARIDEMTRAILAAKVRLGLFESPYIDESRREQVLKNPEHRKLARQAAQRSIVLLRNEKGRLPFDRTGKALSSIAVIGPLADDKVAQMSMWGALGDREGVVTVLQGIRTAVGDKVRIEYAKGPNVRREIPSFLQSAIGLVEDPKQTPEEIQQEIAKAVDVSKKADVVVLVLGETAVLNGEYASRSNLKLAGAQQELLEAVAATGKSVVLVLINGRPLDITWASDRVAAIVEAWVPGSEGGNAVADVLFGDTNPSGKLPVTWPRSSGQIPVYYAHTLTHMPEDSPIFSSQYADTTGVPLYPFGFGLSYTTFSVTNLKVGSPQAKLGMPVQVSVDVQNTGKVAGDEVVQLYIHQRSGRASRPIRELKGFQRVTPAPGETKTVAFILGKDELSYWSTRDKRFIQEEAEFDLWVGGDCKATLHGELAVSR